MIHAETMMKQRSVRTATPTTVVAKPFATERVPIVGDVASLGGVTVSNVRFYEAERLIHATRTAGNQCLYGLVSRTDARFEEGLLGGRFSDSWPG